MKILLLLFSLTLSALGQTPVVKPAAKAQTLRTISGALRSTATNLTMIKQPTYQVGGYGSQYDPVKRFGEFTVADWTPCVLDCGTGFGGNVWSLAVDYRKVGFSHSTYRSFWNGNLPKQEVFWNSAPREAKAVLTYMDGPFFNANVKGEEPRYHLDPTGALTPEGRNPNYWRGLEQMPQIKERIEKGMKKEIEEHALVAYDYECSDYLPDNPGKTRDSLEGGKYKHESKGGTHPEWKKVADEWYWHKMTEAGSKYWNEFDAAIRSHQKKGDLFFQYSNGNAGTLGGGRPSGYGGGEERIQEGTNGTGLSLHWYTWTGKFWHSDLKDFTSCSDQYYNQTTAQGSRAMNDLMWTYEIQYRGSLSEMKIRGKEGRFKPAVVFVAPFQERNPRKGWRQEHEPATEQVGKGMAILPWFYKGGGWLWGTEAHPEWGQEITGINGVQAKGEGTDHFIAGRKMIAQLAPFKRPDTQVVCVEISLDGGKTWNGNSTDFMEGTRAKNAAKYNAYFVHDRTKDGRAEDGFTKTGCPLVLGLRAHNGAVAVAATRIGGMENGKITFKARIKRANNYWQSDITLVDREWVVGYGK